MSERRKALLTSAVLTIAALASACAPTPTPTPAPLPDYISELVFAVPRGSTEALLDPLVVPAAQADAQFDPSEPILVASVNGEERAYSLIQMGIHEVVNDEIGGVPVAVTW